MGIPESFFEQLDALTLPDYDDRWSREQVEGAPPTSFFEESFDALDNLLSTVDQDWLKAQGQGDVRLGSAFLKRPLHIVGGTRLPPADVPASTPQRWAHMLLVAIDNRAKRDDLDFFAAASFVPDVIALAERLPLIKDLGPYAADVFASLKTAPDDKVSASIYELLVGTTCRRRGLNVEMLRESRASKSPDFRVHDLGIPAVVECKRRLRLSQYELVEARWVEHLYGAVRTELRDRGLHGAIGASFDVPLLTVSADAFAKHVLDTLRHGRDLAPSETEWGWLSFVRLPYDGDVRDPQVGATRLYSPDFLEKAFGWKPLQDEWDGIICEVEPPSSVRVQRYRDPLCLKWRSSSAEALLKKTRGITSLWADAAKQIPAGESGILYLAYPEGGRAELADARTDDIRESTTRWWHRWSVRLPLTVVSRLYPRALGVGTPDLIESAVPIVEEGMEYLLSRFPTLVFSSKPLKT